MFLGRPPIPAAPKLPITAHKAQRQPVRYGAGAGELAAASRYSSCNAA